MPNKRNHINHPTLNDFGAKRQIQRYPKYSKMNSWNLLLPVHLWLTPLRFWTPQLITTNLPAMQQNCCSTTLWFWHCSDAGFILMTRLLCTNSIQLCHSHPCQFMLTLNLQPAVEVEIRNLHKCSTNKKVCRNHHNSWRKH